VVSVGVALPIMDGITCIIGAALLRKNVLRSSVLLAARSTSRCPVLERRHACVIGSWKESLDMSLVLTGLEIISSSLERIVSFGASYYGKPSPCVRLQLLGKKNMYVLYFFSAMSPGMESSCNARSLTCSSTPHVMPSFDPLFSPLMHVLRKSKQQTTYCSRFRNNMTFAWPPHVIVSGKERKIKWCSSSWKDSRVFSLPRFYMASMLPFMHGETCVSWCCLLWQETCASCLSRKESFWNLTCLMCCCRCCKILHRKNHLSDPSEKNVRLCARFGKT
jgi:hypothetical protein